MSAANRLALAEAMQLHNERLNYATAQVCDARDLLEKAEARRQLVVRARDEFIRAMKEYQQGGTPE